MSEDRRNREESEVTGQDPSHAEGDHVEVGRESLPPEGGEHAESEEQELRRRVGELEAELGGLNDRHLRLAAEFENYRRRAQNELRESSERAQATLVGQLLQALDDLERVGQVQPETASVEDVLDGVELVTRKLNRILEEAGAEMLDPAGEEFTPATMEAVMRVPADSPQEDDRVHEVFQKGCVFRGHLVRPARVSVQKHE